jgi:flagellar biosynthesis/type III secretory pathway protein FliH
MNVISLPNGKIIKPVDVDSIKVHHHFFSSTKFYVQVSLKDGSTEDIAEQLDEEKASALREEYEAKVRDCYADIDAHQLGHADGHKKGYQEGYDEGHKAGRQEGYDSGYKSGREEGYEAGHLDGYSAGMESAAPIHHERFLNHIYEFLAELVTEQRDAGALTRDRSRYLRHSIDAITVLIERLKRT